MAERACFRGGTLVTMDPQRRVVRGDLWVEDGRIVAIGEHHDAAGFELVDVTGLHVLPGFVQGHVHLGQALFRGLAEGRELMDWLRDRVWPLEAAHTDESAYWSAMLGAADCLASGTTTIADIGIVNAMDAVFRAIVDSGVRAVAGKCLMDTGERVPGGLVQRTDEALAEAHELERRWAGAGQGRIDVSLCPRFILSCSERLWEGVVEHANARGLPIHTHLLEHSREEHEVQAVLGRSQLEFLDDLGVLDTDLRIAHGVQFDRSHAERLAGRSLAVVHCPSANLKLGSGIADLPFLEGTPGVVLGIGCDGAPCNNDMDVLEEMRLAALLQGIKGGPGSYGAERVLALGTIEGARALGMADRIGSLEPGKAADLVVLDLERPSTFASPEVSVYDRIVFTAARDAVRRVYVAGRLAFDRGRTIGFDSTELLRRAGEELDALLRRANL